MVALPASVQTLRVERLIGPLLRTKLIQLAPNIRQSALLRRFRQEAALTYLYAHLITNFTTEQGGSVALKPSAATSKSSKATVLTTFLFSKEL